MQVCTKDGRKILDMQQGFDKVPLIVHDETKL